MRWLPSYPYPPARPDEGFWGEQTSTINWCEEDYYATIYSAEIVNSLTNLAFMYLGYKGICSCIKNGHDSIFLISFIGYTLIGAGSFAFHSSLKYPMQLVDELSMIYTTCVMAYATFSFKKSRQLSIILGLGLFGVSAFITAVYHYLQDPDFHQNAFAILAIVVVFRSIYVMEISLRPSFNKEKKTSLELKRDEQILHDMWWMVSLGLGVFLGGFGIWSLDNHYCCKIREWRCQVGLPWGILLEGHGWWHLMTGAGAYMYIVWGIWIRHCLNGRQDEFVLEWKHKLRSLPDIVRVPAKAEVEKLENGNGLRDITNKQNGQNGLSKKMS